MNIRKKIDLGMPTLIELSTLQENIDLCNELGLNLLEINMNLPQFQLGNLKETSKNNTISYSLHLPEELNVWDFNEKVRNAYFETIEVTVEIARLLDIKILNMHMNLGIYFTLQDEEIFLFNKFQNYYMDKTKAFARKMNEILDQHNIKIHIENTGIYHYNFIADAVNEMLKYDCFSLTWDVGHDHSSGNKDIEIIENNLRKVTHMHLHDAIGKNNHLPLGRG